MIAGLSGACSSDILRFNDSPFANPFSGRADTATTGSISVPNRRVSASSLGMSSSSSLMQPMPGNVSSVDTAAMTQVAAAGNQPVLGSVAGWSATGGTPVTLGAGDTIEKLSGRYGVPVQALRSVNGLSGKSQPSPGQQFIIPAYNPGVKGEAAKAQPVPVAKAQPAPVVPQAAPRAPTPAPVAAQTKPRYESLTRTAATQAQPPEKPRAPRYESLTSATPKTAAAPAKVATQPMPPMPPKKAEPVKAPAKQAAQPQSVAEAPKKVAKVEEARPVAKAAPKSEPKAEPDTTASIGDSQEFRWPARGRVIAGYGSRGPGGTNEGINIAVPEGTPVKAAESGTVAYVGEEIKGYGKMVLIRHPNGYVSAYAHNSDFAVKRGDAVKRGQVIAKSGQTGNVVSPQLHFELRKGSQPVDPSKFLEGQ